MQETTVRTVEELIASLRLLPGDGRLAVFSEGQIGLQITDGSGMVELDFVHVEEL